MKSVSFCTDLTHRRWSLLFRSEVWQGKETGNPGENESLSLAPSSLCYFLCPWVEGRALTLGTREQREFRGFGNGYLVYMQNIRVRALYNWQESEREKGNPPLWKKQTQSFRSLWGRGLLSCLYSTEMINLPGLRLVCPPSPTVPESLKKSGKSQSLLGMHTEAEGIHTRTLKPDRIELRILRQEMTWFYHSRRYMQRRVFIRERHKCWLEEEPKWLKESLESYVQDSGLPTQRTSEVVYSVLGSQRDWTPWADLSENHCQCNTWCTAEVRRGLWVPWN